ncbi:MAG: ASKHA domain-containing protein, partial [Lachnospiraceae bacterium]|nr:ASKHA domain-containing protein [Lachnospiraceae bacterium]
MAKRKFGIAVDIGTTTIEAALISENGEIARTSLCPNAGTRFGADVMSRIRAASEGHGEELSALLKQNITEAIRKLLAVVYDADGGVSVTSTGGPETDGADTQGPPPMVEPASCTAIVLAGNTAMLHMLNGYDCSGLGVYPYSPVTLAWEEKSVQDLFPGLPAVCAEARVILLPGISAFVGADITAGLYACGLAEGSPVKPASAKTQEPASADGSPVKPASAETQEPASEDGSPVKPASAKTQEPASVADGTSPVSGQTTLFLDLGTNGEMALITPDDRTDRAGNTRIRVCSTAAGPVFEGAGIRDGMRGTPGAIAEVVLVPGAGRDPASAVQTRCRTIDNAPAVGICGSGVLEAVSELARLHLIDKDGLLSEPWFTEGFPLA